MRRYRLPVIAACCFTIYLSMLQARSNRGSFQYISPKPGAQLVSKETNIIVRPGGILAGHGLDIASLFRVEGSVSGFHTGDVIVSDDEKTIIFKPHESFEPGERVTVSIDRGLRTQSGIEIGESSFEFRVSPKRIKSAQKVWFPKHEWNRNVEFDKGATRTQHHESQVSGYSLPSDFPSITVTASDNPDSGYLFLSSFTSPNTVQYMMILDNAGSPLFFRKMPGLVTDFKKQPNGLLTYFLSGPEAFYAMDDSYTVVDSFRTGNGFPTDLHELQILSNGHALLMSYDFQPMDMSQIVPGGDPDATVIGLIIQELDQSKDVVFQWRSWDHFEITDATQLDLTNSTVDYVHGNAIELDFDGNLLISSRHMDEITKIDRQTGEIIWRLGGKNNQFTFINDSAQFSYQHDIRRLPNGNITLFDNGNFHSPPFSRAVEYQMDELNKTATLVWEYRNTPDTYGAFMGNVQRLSAGNTLIGWGGTSPNGTEVRPDGSKALELTFNAGTWSYRAFRFPWSGVAAAPYLWADTSNATVTLNFVKFGDANVVEYYVYQGESPAPATKVDSTTDNSLVITGLVEGRTYYFRVTALDGQSNESPFSNEIEITPPFITARGPSDDLLPKEYSVFQNYPNPFNPTTTIRYELPTNSHVVLKIFNLLGQEVATLVDEEKSAGRFEVTWDAGGPSSGSSRGAGYASQRVLLSTGVYFYQLQAIPIDRGQFGEYVEMKKLILLK